MAIEHTYQPQYVTELNEASQLSSTDWLLISQKLSSNTTYLSKKISIQTFTDSIFSNLDAASKSDIDALSLLVLRNISNINSLSSKIDELISCVVKMANCIQTNKANIATLSAKI